MKKLSTISEDVKEAFIQKDMMKIWIVTTSNRPDLCQYQCNGALSAQRIQRHL